MSLPQPQTIAVNGVNLCYFEWGQADAPVIICLHSHTAHAGIWDEFGPYMSGAYHVYALDQRGHGDSSWADGSYDRDRYVEDLTAFMEALSIKKAILVGASMGGWNSLLYTAANPDAIEKIVLVDIGPEPSVPPGGVAPVRPPRPLEFDSFEAAFEYSRSDNPWPTGERLRSDLRRKLRQDESGKLHWKADTLLFTVPLSDMQDEALIARYWDAVASIPCPILELRGEESVTVSDAVVNKMKETAVNLECIDVSGAGHVVSLDKPDDFNAVVGKWIAG